MADDSPVSRVESIKSRVSHTLRQRGHTVKCVYRVFSPGDEGAWDNMTTAEFVNNLDEPRTAIFWSEERKLKNGRTVQDEKVKTVAGWRGFSNWDPPA